MQSRRAGLPRGTWALTVYAFCLLSIGLTADWRLRHEDNGAMQTTLALSHLQLGLAATRAHDVFFNPHTGEATPYGHHPPATALVLAGVFALTGSDAPAVARLTVIAFHIGTLLLFVALLRQFFEPRLTLLGGFVMATLPMSSYFGRMVNYEPVCLFAVLLQNYAYVRCKSGGGLGAWMLLSLGIVAGGLVDWPSLFFTAGLAAVELVEIVGRRASFRLFGVIAASAVAIVGFDLWHLWWAGRGGIGALASVVSSNRAVWDPQFTVLQFGLGQIDTFRRYFTHVGLLSALAVSLWLVLPRTRWSRRLFDVPDAPVLKLVLVAMGGAALAYLLVAPNWAWIHQYWQFYALPAAVLSIVLCWRVLEQLLVERRTTALQVVRVLCILEVLSSSAYWLYFRYSRVETYAVEATAAFRATYLVPRSFDSGLGAGQLPK